MSLWTKKGRVALSILRVHAPKVPGLPLLRKKSNVIIGIHFANDHKLHDVIYGKPLRVDKVFRSCKFDINDMDTESKRHDLY